MPDCHVVDVAHRCTPMSWCGHDHHLDVFVLVAMALRLVFCKCLFQLLNALKRVEVLIRLMLLVVEVEVVVEVEWLRWWSLE